MPVTRATTTDVVSRVRDILREEAQQAAGNTLLSHAEQATLSNALLKDTAASMRIAGGAGARVAVDALVDAATDRVSVLLGRVNQTSGTGAATVSQQEIRDLAALDGSAAQLVAHAYQLITGRAVAVDATEPATPTDPAPSSGPVELQNVRLVYQPDNLSMEFAAAGNVLTVKGRARLPATIEIDVGARHLRLPFVAGTGAYPDAITVRHVIERLRAELPDLDLHVSSFLQGRAVIDFWPRGTAPQNATPVYGMCYGVEMTGPLACKMNADDLPLGTDLTFRVDEKLYTVTARAGRMNSMQLLADLASLMEADGRTVTFRNYGRMGMGSLSVTG
jgi:hypothetical protein